MSIGGEQAGASRDDGQGKVIGMGSRLTLLDGYGRTELEIVPSEVTELHDHKHLSANSLLGQALLGRRVGDEVRLHTPMGIYMLRILDVY
jgi:transcription elongation GreA/GreB family factor